MIRPRPRRAGRALARLALAGALAITALGATGRTARSQVSVLGRPISPATAANVAAPSLGLSVTWGGAQAIPALRDDARNDFPAPVTLTVTWTGMTTPTTLCAVGYFQNPAAALATATDAIAAAVVRGRVTGAGPTTPFTPFSQTGCSGGVGTNGGSLRLLERTLTGDGTVTATLQLQLDLTGQPAVPPGIYTGTLNIRAVVQ